MPAVLVCGGAGYIGAHMCKALAAAGLEPVVFDNLSTGHREAVRWGPLVEGDLLDPAALAGVFSAHRVDAVLHFAARSLVAESMREPGLYFRNNVTGTLNLLDAMRTAGVGRLVFSSTAAVYGDPVYAPIDEAHPTAPINPYGWSKLLAERQIAEYCRAHGLRAACLRYFNAAGADPDGELGEAHDPETHLIPNLLRAALARTPAEGGGEPAGIFGDDYDTPDGTCVRDYIHVADLCDAHLLALARLDAAPGMQVFNLGGGHGSSVAEVLAVCREVSGAAIPERRLPRRPGDPAVLVASSDAARRELGWQPRYGLRDCVAHALAWERARQAASIGA
jgi:UDP-glucose-4-epimerase GalE